MPRSPRPAWAAGLPRGAVPPRSEVPPLKGRQRRSFESRWRALTIARLYGHYGWTLRRIAEHFGFIPERARQVAHDGGWWGRRGEMTSLDPRTWPTVWTLFGRSPSR